MACLWNHVECLVVGDAPLGNDTARLVDRVLECKAKWRYDCSWETGHCLNRKWELPHLSNFILEHLHHTWLFVASGLVISTLQHQVEVFEALRFWQYKTSRP